MALTAQQLTMRFGERQLFEIDRLAIAPGDAIWLHGALSLIHISEPTRQ